MVEDRQKPKPKLEKEKKTKKDVVEIITSQNIGVNDKEVNEYINCLSKARVSDYDSWMNCGYALHNYDNSIDGFKLWEQLSKKSDKYDAAEWKVNGYLYKNYCSFGNKKHQYSLKSLKKWAKLDSPDLYDLSTKASNNVQYVKNKEKFELNNFKLLNPLTYCTVDKNKNLIQRNKQDFLNVYENFRYEKTVTNDKGSYPKTVSFVNEWLLDETARTYDRKDFLPKQVCDTDIYNTFTKFTAESKKKSDKNIKDSLILKHIRMILCNDDEDVFNYFIKWLAVKLQDPARKVNTSMIFRSVEGTGKDLFFNYFGNNILGSKYYVNEDKAEIYFGRFNSMIEDRILAVVNESSVKDNMNMTNNIKNAITKDYNTIEHKGLKPYLNKNHIAWVFLANNKNPVTVSSTDRRFCAVECCNKYANNPKYLTPLLAEIESGEYDRLFYDYLMEQDLSKINFTADRPRTQFFKDLQEINVPVIAKFLDSYLLQEEDDNIVVSNTKLFAGFKAWLESNGFEKYNMNTTRFGLDLKEYAGIVKSRGAKGFKLTIDKTLVMDQLVKSNYVTLEVKKDDQAEEVDEDDININFFEN